jgi:23S rRNA G2445 N2-methylase RlmL
MEFKINNIDLDLRQRVEDITSEGMVHNKTAIKLNKDGKHEQKNKKHDLSNSNKKINVDVFKDGNDRISVDVFKEKENDIMKGSFLDVRK